MDSWSRQRVVAATVLAPLSWGTTAITVTEFLPKGRPLLVAAMRVLPAGLVLVALGSRQPGWRPIGAAWARAGVLAACNFALFFPLLAVGIYRLPGGVAASGGGLQPMVVAALTWLLLRRRPRRIDLAVGLVAAIGVAMVVIRPGAGFDRVGLLAVVGANTAFAFGVVLTKRLPVPVNRTATTGWQLLIGAALLVPLALAIEGLPPPPTARNVAGFAYLSLCGTGLAYLVWFNGIRRLPSVAPPLLGLAAPVTGAALGWIVLGQSLSPVQLAGFALALGAISYGALQGARASRAATPGSDEAVLVALPVGVAQHPLVELPGR
jgi:probable blue pigment (indigoidine) exporter